MLLAFQVPQGNLKLLDAHPELSPSETRDRLHASVGDPRTMVTVSSSSRMRVVLCWGPSARAFILALALGHLRLAEALPMVARPSSSYARGVLPRVVNFKGGNGSSSHFSKLVAVDAYEILDIGGPPYGGYELALLDPLPSFARVLVPRVPGPFNQSTGMLYSTIFGGVISPASGTRIRDACMFPIGKVPRGPERCPRPVARGGPMIDFPLMVPIMPLRAALSVFIFRSSFPLRVKMLLLVLGGLVGVEAVCPHCKDTIVPAHNPTACPLIAELTKNADIFATKKLGSSPTVAYSMTHELSMQFTRPVVDAIVGLACAPVQGVQIDFTDAAYSQASAVVKAAVYGHCSFAEASAVLAERLDAATLDIDVSKIRGAMESLKSAGETAVNSATGTFLFVWAKISNVISKRLDFTYKLDAAAKSKSAAHSVTLVRPETEAEFYEMTHLFIMAIIALGLASAPIVMKFIDDVVFATVRMRESFRVAHELLICYFREMDFDPARQMHMGNVFRRGGQDTLLSEARRNAAAFFRAGGGILQPKGITADKVGDIKINKDIKPNGKDDPDNKKPCPDFNGGRPCKKLKPDGTCVLAHRCNQFVSDKGPGGYCFGVHARCTGCDYDAAKKLRAPAQ